MHDIFNEWYVVNGHFIIFLSSELVGNNVQKVSQDVVNDQFDLFISWILIKSWPQYNQAWSKGVFVLEKFRKTK